MECGVSAGVLLVIDCVFCGFEEEFVDLLAGRDFNEF